MTAPEVRYQISKFAIVGGLATLVHACVYAALASLMGAAPLLANLVAYLFAFLVSFTGHLHWTFAKQQPQRRALLRPLIRFFLISLAGFWLNTLAVFVVTQVMEVPPMMAVIPMILVTPVLTFFLSRAWAFDS